MHTLTICSNRLKPDDDKFNKWVGWIGTILTDAQGILLNRYVFREVQSIVAANPKIHQSSAFYDWMTMQYQVTASIGLRRQLDTDKNSVSLCRLMTEVKAHPTVLSRSRHVRAFIERGHSAEHGNHDFDELAGEGEERIQPITVGVELNDFIAKSACIKKYINKRIAHIDASHLNELPTNNDLESAIDYLEQLVIRYTILLRRESHISLVPTFVYDWRAIFYQPWIANPFAANDE